MFITGFVEIASLGSVLPFLSYLSNPDILWRQPYVQYFASFLDLQSSSDLLIPVTLLFIVFAILCSITRLVNLWLNGLLAAGAGSDLSSEVFKISLYQPYSYHINNSTSEIITTSTLHVGTCAGAINTSLQLITSFIVSVSLAFGLLLSTHTLHLLSFLFFLVPTCYWF